MGNANNNVSSLKPTKFWREGALIWLDPLFEYSSCLTPITNRQEVELQVLGMSDTSEN